MDTKASPRRPTMHDVAHAAGVSLKTVSRAINGESNVSPDTQARVLEAVEALGFRRNDMARDLRSGRRSSSIGLVIEDVSNPFYSAITRAVEEVAHRHDVLVIAASSNEDPARERELVETLSGRRVDGLLMVPAGTNHRYLRAELAVGTAVVFLDRPPVGIRADAVLLDDAGASRSAIDHLVGRGHRRIAVLGDRADIYTMQTRVAGFRSAMSTAGLAVDESLIRMDLHAPADAAAATAELLDSHEPPTAFFGLNNRMTIGVVRAVWQRGFDVEVVGFDDFELSDMVPVPLTVVAHDPGALGRVGAELLFDRLGGKGGAKARTVVMPSELVVRGMHRSSP